MFRKDAALGDRPSRMADEEESDESLYKRWCEGNSDAGNRLFERHYGPMYDWVQGKVRKVPDDIAETTQRIFEALLKQEFRGGSSFRTYIFKIARYKIADYWREQRRSSSAIDIEDISVESHRTSVGTLLARGEGRAQLRHALCTLPLKSQQLLELSFWGDFDDRQLAEIFEVAPATIRSRRFRALEALHALLLGSEHEPVGFPPMAEDDLEAWARPVFAAVRKKSPERKS